MTNVKQRALITGATGFIGSHLARALLNDGWDVHIIVRESSNLNILRDVSDKITVHKYNGTILSMISIVKAANPTIVFHLASKFIASHNSEDIHDLIVSNVEFGTQLLEAMLKNNVYKLINTGTAWQHYNNETYNPVCLYAATKEAFEAIKTFYLQTTPLQSITLKLFDTFGPNDPRNKLFTILRNASKTKETIQMSPGKQLIDLVYIDDVVEAFIKAAEILQNSNYKEKHQDYAVSSQRLIELKQLVEMYATIKNISLNVNWGGRPYRNREVMIPWSNGQSLPGWSAKISVEEGIRRLE